MKHGVCFFVGAGPGGGGANCDDDVNLQFATFARFGNEGPLARLKPMNQRRAQKTLLNLTQINAGTV